MSPVAAASWLEKRLWSPGAKRILSIDGGGASPLVSIGILSELETRLSRLSGRDDFRLADYFDLIGGVSTGAAPAACLALGASTAEAADLCGKLAVESFAPGPAGLRAPRFDVRAVDKVLARTLGDVDLSAPTLRTGLAIFAKSAESGALWVMSNNPRGRYWERNKTFLVRRLIQASLAAPVAVEDIAIPLGPGDEPVERFVDAATFGLSNPSLHLLLMATLRGYGLEWHTGPDRILMLSVGAGAWPLPDMSSAEQDADQVAAVLANVNHDASQMAVTVLQGVGATFRPWRINSELEDMAGATISPVPGLQFQRMEASLSPKALGVDASELAAIRAAGPGDVDALNSLHEIGRQAAERYFAPPADHPKRRLDRSIFPRRFDPPGFRAPTRGAPRFKLQALGRTWKD
jgi:hypothetical protein